MDIHDQPEPEPLLRGVVIALDHEHERRGLAQPCLYGVHGDGRFALVDQGDPYRMLEVFSMLPGETFAALALVCSGWAAPMGEGRPSRHPARERIRSVTAVTAAGDGLTLLRRRGKEPELLGGGGGALFDAMKVAAATLARPSGRPGPRGTPDTPGAPTAA
jgi:hypothetical protein